MAQVRLLTAEDLVGLPDDYELDEGVPRPVAAAPDVSAVAVNVVALIWIHVDARDLGTVTGANASFRLARNPDTVYLPDAAFVRAERISSEDDMTYPVEGAPDLAVEVRSPGNSAAALDRTMRRYLAAGTLLGWLVDPVARTVGVYRPGVPVEVRRDTDALDGGDVLPGLQIPIARILRVRPRRQAEP